VVVEVVVLDAAADVGRAGWEAPLPPVPMATASAPVVGTGSRTWWGSPATRKSARGVARRWSANNK